MKKLLATAVILLFVGVTIATDVNANVTEDGRLISVIVSEFKPDGTIKRNFIKISLEKVKKMRQDLQNVKDMDERLLIYKEYGLIPKQVTLEKLRKGMEEKAERMGFLEGKIEQFLSINKLRVSRLDEYEYVINFMCLVSGFHAIGIRLYNGLSWFTSFINWLIFFELDEALLIPSVDAINVGFCYVGDMETRGLLGSKMGVYTFILFSLIGFVGFVIGYLPIPVYRIIFGAEEYFGFAVFAFSTGKHVDVPFNLENHWGSARRGKNGNF